MYTKTLTSRTKNDIPTSADRAYEIIFEKILSGELAPGEKLSIRTMSRLTGVSMIPVIEALHRLEYEGLVESFPRWGSRVVSLTPETVRDRNMLREAVECQVVRLLAEMGLSKEQEHQLRFMAEELDATPRTDERNSPFWKLHYEFHMKMAEYTGCQSLIRALHNVNLFHLLQRIVLLKPALHAKTLGDLHQKILGKIVAKDPDGAEKAMRDHIRVSVLTQQST
ncbi:MAG: GntR family transcriptional regulator [Spirochaetes bacterium]|nr:GntR family transcriptional regulator [Spirochaetota bacterium]